MFFCIIKWNTLKENTDSELQKQKMELLKFKKLLRSQKMNIANESDAIKQLK